MKTRSVLHEDKLMPCNENESDCENRGYNIDQSDTQYTRVHFEAQVTHKVLAELNLKHVRHEAQSNSELIS